MKMKSRIQVLVGILGFVSVLSACGKKDEGASVIPVTTQPVSEAQTSSSIAPLSLGQFLGKYNSPQKVLTGNYGVTLKQDTIFMLSDQQLFVQRSCYAESSGRSATVTVSIPIIKLSPTSFRIEEQALEQEKVQDHQSTTWNCFVNLPQGHYVLSRYNDGIVIGGPAGTNLYGSRVD